MTSHDASALLARAVDAAHQAGAELNRRYGNVQGYATKSSATDPVTDADRTSEELLVRLLTDGRPGDGLIGEEGASRPSTSGITWVVDPLDGTVNYLYQLDNFAVSIAAEDDQGALVGVVHDPRRDLTYTTVRGRGAWLGDRRLAVNDPVALGEAMVGTGFGYDSGRRARQAAVVAGLLPQIRDIRRIGSAALDLCSVAAGNLDAFYEEGVQAWDVAAGGLVAVEAGALMTPIKLTDAPTGWVVAGPGLHGELVAALHRGVAAR